MICSTCTPYFSYFRHGGMNVEPNGKPKAYWCGILSVGLTATRLSCNCIAAEHYQSRPGQKGGFRMLLSVRTLVRVSQSPSSPPICLAGNLEESLTGTGRTRFQGPDGRL